MGFTYASLEVVSPAQRERSVRLRLLVDSGAFYSVIPKTVLSKLGIEPEKRERFKLVNGKMIYRRVGNVLFRFGSRLRAAPVIFGEKGDRRLLGVVALEALGMQLDPVHKRLRPAEMLLTGFSKA